MNKAHLFWPFLAIISWSCSIKLNEQEQEKESKREGISTVEKFNNHLQLAGEQYKYLMHHVPADSFPKTYENDKYEFSGSGWWCSGFYPGTLFYLHKEPEDDSLLAEAHEKLKILEKEQYNSQTHDLGFMMFCSFGNALKIEPNETYKEILINSANSLASRFNPTVGCIRSWDSDAEDFLVIIDSMVNLELLLWATQETNDSSYYHIAVSHANTTLKNHFRPDNSSYHVVNYDAQTGEIRQKKTAQGYSDDSAWARGQMWGLYGYTMMYRYTNDQKYLYQAKEIAGFILTHPNFPEDKIPYWDFNVPSIPDTNRDASAAAILASALLELQIYVDEDLSKKYVNTAGSILNTLSSDKYRADVGGNGGFILRHSVGHFNQGSEVDVPLTYADYYYVEALKRYIESR